MQRRHALLAATGAAAATMLTVPAAFAQMAAIGGPRYRDLTLELGGFSKQVATLGQQRATHWQIRQFGTFEVDEQTAIAQVLTNTDYPPPTGMTGAQRQFYNSLAGLSGPAFDRAFLEGMLGVHQELLNAQQEYLSGNPVLQPDLEHIAVLARMVIMQHMAMLTDMQHWIPGMMASR